jgi:hypothetical protein
MAALVPARRALSRLTDTNSTGVVRERYWLTFQPGEIRTCTSCHGLNTSDQANQPVPTNTPAALVSLLNYWKTNGVTRPAVNGNPNTNFFQISFTRRPAEISRPGFVRSPNMVRYYELRGHQRCADPASRRSFTDWFAQ